MSASSLVCAVALGLAAGACSGGDDCAWGLDELLAEAHLDGVQRQDCGTFGALQVDAVAQALDCFQQARDRRRPVQLAVNMCIDCLDYMTFVATAKAEIYAIRMESDGYGDAFREASVSRCSRLVETELGTVTCEDASVLYDCKALRHEAVPRAWRMKASAGSGP